MSIYTISNNCLVVSVSTLGAELQSIKSSDGREYLWQGEAEFWSRRSPVLFPFVGALIDDKYVYEGKEYCSGQHGFARDMEFTLKSRDSSKISFVLESNEETLKVYPFEFSLKIEYTLFNNEVIVKWSVENHGSNTMYYSIGAHPAFNLPLDENREDCMILLDKFPSRITEISGRYAVEGSNVKSSVRILPNHTIKLYPDLFANDALVFEDNQVHKVSLCTPDGNPFVDVEYDAPVVGIWSPNKPNCPFVCIEPWYGRCDAVDFNGGLEERKWQNKLEASEKTSYSYKIVLH